MQVRQSKNKDSGGKEKSIGPQTQLNKHQKGSEKEFKDNNAVGKLKGKKKVCWRRKQQVLQRKNIAKEKNTM